MPSLNFRLYWFFSKFIDVFVLVVLIVEFLFTAVVGPWFVVYIPAANCQTNLKTIGTCNLAAFHPFWMIQGFLALLIILSTVRSWWLYALSRKVNKGLASLVDKQFFRDKITWHTPARLLMQRSISLVFILWVLALLIRGVLLR